MPELDLTQFSSTCQLSAGLRDSLAEAARVMLDRYHENKSPMLISWQHNGQTRLPEATIKWDPSDIAMRTSHGNLKDATEDGAYAVAIATAADLGYTVLGRTEQGSGCDWFMSKDNLTYKLEVSGIAEAGSPGNRLTGKVIQGKSGTMVAAGLAVVFRFKEVSLHSETWT